MGLNFKDWVSATHSSYGDDPTQWNGTNPSCKLCDKEIEMNSEYCEEHQECVMCGDNDDCGCKEEWSGVSSCCEAKMDTDQKLCYRCKDHCSSVWEYENERVC